MGMRYLIRRAKADDFSDLKGILGDIEKQLGTPGKDLRRNVKIVDTPHRHTLYTFMTRKQGEGFIWVCPSVELNAEDETSLLALAKKHNINDLPHITKPKLV